MGKNLPEKLKENREKLWIAGICFLAAIAFITIYSYSTSPRYPYYYGSDSAQFQTMGMAWAAGKIPYRDVFDHKGPMAFLPDMVSYALFGSNFGLYLIQILCMFIDLAAVFQISWLFIKGKGACFVAVAITAAVFAMDFLGGNFGEEYCLPFVFVSILFQLKFLKRQDTAQDHDPKYALLYGIAFGICLFSKVTNALSLCIGVLVILVVLLLRKKFRNILKNAAAFIAGTLIIAVPFSVYFLTKGCFSDMMYAMLTYNVKYQMVMTSWPDYADGDTWYQFFLYYFPYYCVVFTALLNIRARDFKMLAYNLMILVFGGYFFFDGTMGSQYMFMMMPNIPILLGEIFALPAEKEKDLRFVQIFLLGLVCAVCYEVLPTLIRYPVSVRLQYQEKPARAYDVLLEGVPGQERDSFIAWGGSDLKDIYLLNDIVPYYKYFAIQAWHASFDPNVYEDIKNLYAAGDVTWILADDSTGLIQDTLDTRYFIVGQNEGYTLYHINWE